MRELLKKVTIAPHAFLYAASEQRAAFHRNYALSVSAAVCSLIISVVPASAQKKLTFAGSGGASLDAMNIAFIQPWAKQNNVDVSLNPTFDFAKVKAMVDAKSVEWDVFVAEGATAKRLCDVYMEKLDFSVIDTSHLTDAAKKSVNPCFVPVQETPITLTWHKKMANPPKSWADFFDPKIKGKRAIFSSLPDFSGVYEIAMRGAGKPIYPIDFKVVFDQYDKIKDQIVFYNSPAQLQQFLEAGSVDMAVAFTARLDAASRGNPNFQYDFTWKDAFVRVDGLSVAKGAPHAREAMSLLSFFLKPEGQAVRTAHFPVSPVTKNTKLTNPPESAKYVLSPDKLDETVFYRSNDWWTDNLEDAVKRWTAWTLR